MAAIDLNQLQRLPPNIRLNIVRLALASPAKPDDLLKRLPRKLRLVIYRLVLTSNAKLTYGSPEYRPMDVTKGIGHYQVLKPSIGTLLATSRYIYQEAVDILYSENVFIVGARDEDFRLFTTPICKMSNIHVVGRWIDSLACPLALILAAAVKGRAKRMHVKELPLKTVVFAAFRLLPADIQKLRNYPGRVKVVDVDIGVWSLDLGQPFTIQLEDPLLHQSWASIRQSKEVAEYSSGCDLMSKYTAVIKEARELDDTEEIAFGSRLEVTALQAIALDAARGIGLVGDRWRCLMLAAVCTAETPISLRALQHDGLDSIRKLIVADGNLVGPKRLVDVGAQCPRAVIEWANDVLLGVRERVCKGTVPPDNGYVEEEEEEYFAGPDEYTWVDDWWDCSTPTRPTASSIEYDRGYRFYGDEYWELDLF
ncbi:hypothetical protein LTR27_002143 [Elasticomyces elasticus]|nr:hypothetical protein LTR27_002143 [Elasticomyces elasticus]